MDTLASLVGAAMISTRETIFLGLIDAVRDALGEHIDDQTLTSLYAYAEHVRRDHGVPDPMPRGWNMPAPANTGDVVHVLTDAAARVLEGDSFEGLIVWEMPYDDPELDGYAFGLMARYRVGNLDGQGGVRVYSAPEVPE